MSKFSLKNIGAWLSKMFRFLTGDIWRIQLEELSSGKSFLIRQLRIILLALRRFNKDNCFFRASSLTFNTMLSIVPVAAILFGIAKGFGFEAMMRRQILGKFPGHAQQEVLTKVINFAESMLQTAKGGVIAGVGTVVLLWSVINVLSNIEGSLNDIWEVEQGRSWSRRFSDYLALMLLGPVLFIISSSATVFVTARITELTSEIRLLGIIGPVISLGLKLIPYVVIWILFTVIYILMPNTRVTLKAGLTAGIVAGTIFQLVQWGYITFQVGATRYNAIYGSFAALPLFLMWVQISWWVFLFGAEFAFADQNIDEYEFEPEAKKISRAFRKVLTLQIVHLLVKNFAQGNRPLFDVEISSRLKMPLGLVHDILHDLVRSKVISEARTNAEQKYGYQPARDINTITIEYVVNAIDQNGTNSIPVAKTAEFETLSQAIEKFSDEMETSPANKLLKDI
ncbi:MAG: YihY/virulence factor BrkB family protein [Desulfobacterales bacterium]